MLKQFAANQLNCLNIYGIKRQTRARTTRIETQSKSDQIDPIRQLE